MMTEFVNQISGHRGEKIITKTKQQINILSALHSLLGNISPKSSSRKGRFKASAYADN